MSTSREVIEATWGRVVFDCRCPDIYYCPASLDVECPRHSTFDVCYDGLDEHVPVPAELRAAECRPSLPPQDLAQE